MNGQSISLQFPGEEATGKARPPERRRGAGRGVPGEGQRLVAAGLERGRGRLRRAGEERRGRSQRRHGFVAGDEEVRGAEACGRGEGISTGNRFSCCMLIPFCTTTSRLLSISDILEFLWYLEFVVAAACSFDDAN